MKLLSLLVLSWLLKNGSLAFHHHRHATMIMMKKKNTKGANRALHLMPQQLGEFETLSFTNTSARKVQLLDLIKDNDLVEFEEGWDMQKRLLESHFHRLAAGQPHPSQFCHHEQVVSPRFQMTSGLDSIVVLQHQPVYTLGTGSDEKFILSTTNSGAVPVVRMDRGGEVTYHGPGQLTVYPILDLRGYQQDIHWYIRALEEAIIRALGILGLEAQRQEGVTGVWIQNVKVAAIGIKCRRWVTMHGLAVNIEECSLLPFEGIVACGLEGRKVGCLNQFLARKITVADFAPILERALEEVFQIEILRCETI